MPQREDGELENVNTPVLLENFLENDHMEQPSSMQFWRSDNPDKIQHILVQL